MTEILPEPKITKRELSEHEKSIDDEEDEEDDSYDIDEELAVNNVKEKIQKSEAEKSVQHLLEMVGGIAVSEEHLKKAQEQVELYNPFITREGSDDPRRYVDIGKSKNLTQKMLEVCLSIFTLKFPIVNMNFFYNFKRQENWRVKLD